MNLVAAVFTLICRANSVADGVQAEPDDDFADGVHVHAEPDDDFADEGHPRVGGSSVDDLATPVPIR